jgi:hypothetical protein
MQLRKQIIHTKTRLHADERGEPFRALFEQLQKDWRELLLREVELQDGQTITAAEVEIEDVGLDVIVDEVDEITENNESLRGLLFKGKSPSVFKKPIAGVQLGGMETWEGTLARAATTELQMLSSRVSGQVLRAKMAVAKRAEAGQLLREFYTTAERKQFIERVNTARVEVFTYFFKLVTKTPGLTQQYARSFFLQVSDGAYRAEEDLAAVQERLEELRQELAQYEAREKELIALKEAQAQEEAQESAQKAREEELERELNAIRAQRAKKKR